MTEISATFETCLRNFASEILPVMTGLLSLTAETGEIARPAHLIEAMRHGLLNGGKRLRPFLVVETASLLGGNRPAALRVGAALECLHSYSLVHDDLPAMDDDDMRRGKPTVHIAFDEATAILAGDGLLTLAFDTIAAPETALPDKARIDLVLALSRAAGIGGMVGGQALDLAAEKNAPGEEGVVTLQAMKTGALLRFACEAGAIIAGAPAGDLARLRRYGELLGRAFQIADDLLDITSDAATLGKATGKDADRGKGTLVGLKGQDWAVAELARLVDEATSLLSPYGGKARILIEAAKFVAARQN
ncbi:polyprenyl synthetase family protein [Rhizobium halophytocola]|uniref:Farnesyl diphosphate synthase n=1 Tax=Rhizobium halophytocola TaxID=735519 RepID=A0ABS4E567_9HYPH|nr:farnesyl diphosphate synthase [Rhizobium halophytocola]MBP1853056.1 farnesyl diphosphate synthase [Rhizobium halophytocola]